MVHIHSDHLNTPHAVTDENQSIVWRADYEPFGKVTETISTVEMPLRFAGQYQDDETGLHYNNFRTYNTATGRYTQSDPIGLRGGLNSFSYVMSNPTRFTDFYGLEITGEYHSFSASISDWEYLGLTADLSRGDLVDRLGWFNFSASGSLAVTIKCVEKDTCDRPIRTWYSKGTVQVNDARFRIPYTEPALPIPGMGYVILADKMLRAGEHIKQAKDQIMMAGKALLNAPTAICNGAPFQKM